LVQPFGALDPDDLVCTSVRGLDTSNASPPVAERLTRPGGGDDDDDDWHDHLPDLGEVVGGHYRLVLRLGEGMFGCVYLAERTDVPEHRVALKVVDRAVYTGRNVERELVMLAAASHPHIVQLKDHGMTPHYVWLTMPLFEGETLDQRLERGTLSLREAYDIFVPIARGVESLHERGLRHQDIKPENIFLARFGELIHPVLLDLGVAVEKNATFVAGTALYAAPEQLMALTIPSTRMPLSERMDTYCLAATLLYALVGENLYPGGDAETPLAVADAFEDRERAPLPPQALREMSPGARRLLSRALSRWLTRDPLERPSVGELARGLEVLLEEEREQARSQEERVARQRAALGRVRKVFLGLGIIACGAALYGYSKRETWRLAGELERARAEGKASFAELDTCVAAHTLAQGQLSESESALEEERSASEAALVALRKESALADERHQEELDAARGDVTECRNEADRERTAAGRKERALEERLAAASASSERVRAELEKQRDEVAGERRVCEESLGAARERQRTCENELAVCNAERPPAEGAPNEGGAPLRAPQDGDPRTSAQDG
jgi:tRNA A-37 threonylcarbamoyl transferase component Bud32